MRKVLIILLVVSTLGVYSCAKRYFPMNPQSMQFSGQTLSEDISIKYEYYAFDITGNKRNAKRSNNKNTKVVAISITNSTDKEINVGENIDFYAGENKITLLEPDQIFKNSRQIVPGYLPYILLTLVNLQVNVNNNTSVYPIGLILGPGITGLNMGIAASSNKKLLSDLFRFNITNKVIAPGQTEYGIIGFISAANTPIRVKMR